jgi:hypothetical protein
MMRASEALQYDSASVSASARPHLPRHAVARSQAWGRRCFIVELTWNDGDENPLTWHWLDGWVGSGAE